ncbi:MAG TPA: flavodoxin-dependent (E)-4-hydroxy-3-methylbut-2-enyl-diphosphate synthase, partial [Chitinophagaceae bacterium]|nr:flavodoxin-dependent (E)-4-hydroxy-3-methylbut-2-enyl-diphosphate synthase [Chitinophagaceae bacterium]
TYHNIVLSMKSSNPQVMVQAYRLLVKTMFDEFGECYPLHLGVTEAGDGEDGRIKSAVGIGTLLEDGLGDTVRVSLTEDPELEIPICKDLVKRYEVGSRQSGVSSQASNLEPQTSNLKPQTTNLKPQTSNLKLPYDPFTYQRRESFEVGNIGGKHVPGVVADLSKVEKISYQHIQSIGYTYDETSDKWNISDAAADYVFTANQVLDFALPGTLKVIVYPEAWTRAKDKTKYFPIYQDSGYAGTEIKSDQMNFVMIDCFNDGADSFAYLDQIANDPMVVICLSSTNKNAVQSIRTMYAELLGRGIKNPVINITDSNWQTTDEHLIHFATETGALFLDGFGDGICLGMTKKSYDELAGSYDQLNAGGRNYTNNLTIEQFINNTSFGILQATRTRISKTEYISCPSCGRTLFDLQETTAMIRSRTNHLKGLKIAIMGCIVNGPGEMADADFGYVGSGPGKITLYKGKEIVKRNVNSEVAVDELIRLLKENDAWVEP